jgi:hypothetical protein
MKYAGIILIVLLPFLIKGQEIKSGLSIGLNSAKWIGDADLFADEVADGMNMEEGFNGFSFDNKSRIGFSLGFIVDCPVIKAFSIQPELYFIQKGTKLKGDGYITVNDGWNNYTFNVEEDLIMQTNYIDLLVLPKYNLSEGKVKPYILAGPGVGYLVTSKMKVKVKIEDESDSDSEDYEGFKNFDFNFNFGFGFDFSGSIRLDARYQLGIISILDDGSGYDLRNSGIAVNLVAIF